MAEVDEGFDLAVGFAQAGRQIPGQGEQDLHAAGGVFFYKAQESFAADIQDEGVAVGDGRGAARQVLQQGHLAEKISLLQHGQGFFAADIGPLADAHLAGNDHQQRIARVILLEDRFPHLEHTLGKQVGQLLDGVVIQFPEQGEVFKDLDDDVFVRIHGCHCNTLFWAWKTNPAGGTASARGSEHAAEPFMDVSL